jgi:hypothetical protein
VRWRKVEKETLREPVDSSTLDVADVAVLDV